MDQENNEQEKQQQVSTKSLVIYELKLNQPSKPIKFSNTNKICLKTLFLFSLRSAHYAILLLDKMQLRIARLALEVRQHKNSAHLDQILPIAPLFDQCQTKYNFNQCNFHLIPQTSQVYVEFYKMRKMLKFDILISYDEFYVAKFKWFPINKCKNSLKLPMFRTVNDSMKLETFYAGYVDYQVDEIEQQDNRISINLVSNQVEKKQFNIKKWRVVDLYQKKDKIYLISVMLNGSNIIDQIKMSYIDLNQLKIVELQRGEYDLTSDEDVAKLVLMSNSSALI